MIYIAYFLILLMLLKFERQMPNEQNSYRFLIPLVYILFIGLRGANVGVDTPVYYQHYYTFGQWGCDFVEVGFDWLNRFCYHQGWSQAPFFVICAAFAIIPVSYAVNSNLTRKEYSIFMLLFCTTTFITFCNGMRQSMACGIFFFLIFFIQKSTKSFTYKVSIYILGIIFASLFHASIFLVSPLILLNRISLSNKKYILIYISSFAFIFINVSAYLPAIELGSRDYGRYLGGELTEKSASSLGFIVTTLRNVLFLILLVKINAFKRFTLLANIAFLMLVFTNMGFNIPLVSRINMYFTPFYTLMLAIVISDTKIRLLVQTRVLLFGLITIVLVLTVYAISSPANKVSSYTFYWMNSDYNKYIEL